MVRSPNGREQMVSKISLTHLMSHTTEMGEVEHRLSMFTKEYIAALSRCKEQLRYIEKEKREKGRVNPLHFWYVGDSLIPYLSGQPQQDSFVLHEPYHHFARDLSVSKSTLEKAVTFRRRFGSPQAVDTTKSWDYYRESRYLKGEESPPPMKVAQQARQQVIVFVRLTVPASADSSWLTARLRRWLYGKDDSTLPPTWLEEEGIKVETYEVFYRNKSVKNENDQ